MIPAIAIASSALAILSDDEEEIDVAASTDLETLRVTGLKKLGVPKRAGVGENLGEWVPFTPEGSPVTGWTWDNPEWMR